MRADFKFSWNTSQYIVESLKLAMGGVFTLQRLSKDTITLPLSPSPSICGKPVVNYLPALLLGK